MNIINLMSPGHIRFLQPPMPWTVMSVFLPAVAPRVLQVARRASAGQPAASLLSPWGLDTE